MVPTIRVDDEVWKELQSRAEPFVDNPNSVLRRLLSLTPGRPIRQQPSRQGQIAKSARSKGRFLSQIEYRQPILEALAAMGGEGQVDEVLRRVHARLESRMGEADYESMPSTPEDRWRNLARWERKNMIKEGLLEGNSPRGIWRLTDSGWTASGRPRPTA